MTSVLGRHPGTDNYVLLTDVPLTAGTRAGLSDSANEAGFTGNFAVVDGKEVCQFLDLYPHVRRSYPQLLGLADLEVIVNHELYARSQAYLEAWQPRLATYVQTEAHARALALLKQKHFIVLDGPPEAGKTTIAAAVAMIYATDGYEVIAANSTADLFRPTGHSSAGKGERLRLFIADDAIGSLSLESGRITEWSRDLPAILRQLNSGRLLVWTARRYILEEALANSRLAEAIAGFPKPHEVLVEVGKLSMMERAGILYNHAKQADLGKEHRKLIRSHAWEIAGHPNFSPLRMSQLISVVLKQPAGSQPATTANWTDVLKFLNDPSDTWIRAFRQLSSSEQTLLSAMLDFDGPTKVGALKQSYDLRLSKREGSHIGFEACVTRLDHSFLSVTSTHDGERYISMQHPSLRDMLLLELRGDVNARRRYISLASAFALGEIIGGIASGPQSASQRAVTPTDDQEFAIFLNRLKEVLSQPLSLREWERIFAACERLIPLKPQQTNPTDSSRSHFWDLLTGFFAAREIRTCRV